MNLSEIKAHWPTMQEAANAIGVERQTLYRWAVAVPDERQLEIEKLTHGRLKADPVIRERYARLLGLVA